MPCYYNGTKVYQKKSPPFCWKCQLIVVWASISINFSNVRQYHCHFSIFNDYFLYQRTKSPQGTVLLINLLVEGLVWNMEAPSDEPLG